MRRSLTWDRGKELRLHAHVIAAFRPRQTSRSAKQIDGEIEDPEGHLAVLDMALLHLVPRWQNLGVLDEHHEMTRAVLGYRDE